MPNDHESENTSSSYQRILALDLGRKRIGLALSDPLGITAQGLPTLDRTTMRVDIGTINRIASENGAASILLGLPRTLRGDEAKQAEWVRDFGARLKKRSGLPIVYWDERFTSVEAERVLKQEKGDRFSRKGQVDRLAASILLQSFLDAGSPGIASKGASSVLLEDDNWSDENEPDVED